ncbi:MAG: hypothetical protein ACTSU5_12225 [Promethearchaeota archaeon]
MSSYEDLFPLHARSTIAISGGGVFSQVLYFEYEDRGGEYHARVKGDASFEQEELDLLSANMQEFLDGERNYVNREPVFPEVKLVDIGFVTPMHPFHCFVVQFSGPTREGRNTYRSEFPPEDPLEYDIHSVYMFPPRTRVVGVSTEMEYWIAGNTIVFWAPRGCTLGNLEEITFEFDA